MTDVIGIDHIYITVTDLERSEDFYDRVLLDVLGFRKNKFGLNGDPHVQYYNRHFGYVLRPSRTPVRHDAYTALFRPPVLVQTVPANPAQCRPADLP